jgi:hypothetical protein
MKTTVFDTWAEKFSCVIDRRNERVEECIVIVKADRLFSISTSTKHPETVCTLLNAYLEWNALNNRFRPKTSSEIMSSCLSAPEGIKLFQCDSLFKTIPDRNQMGLTIGLFICSGYTQMKVDMSNRNTTSHRTIQQNKGQGLVLGYYTHGVNPIDMSRVELLNIEPDEIVQGSTTSQFSNRFCTVATCPKVSLVSKNSIIRMSHHVDLIESNVGIAQTVEELNKADREADRLSRVEAVVKDEFALFSLSKNYKFSKVIRTDKGLKCKFIRPFAHKSATLATVIGKLIEFSTSNFIAVDDCSCILKVLKLLWISNEQEDNYDKLLKLVERMKPIYNSIAGSSSTEVGDLIRNIKSVRDGSLQIKWKDITVNVTYTTEDRSYRVAPRKRSQYKQFSSLVSEYREICKQYDLSKYMTIIVKKKDRKLNQKTHESKRLEISICDRYEFMLEGLIFGAKINNMKITGMISLFGEAYRGCNMTGFMKLLDEDLDTVDDDSSEGTGSSEELGSGDEIGESYDIDDEQDLMLQDNVVKAAYATAYQCEAYNLSDEVITAKVISFINNPLAAQREIEEYESRGLSEADQTNVKANAEKFKVVYERTMKIEDFKNRLKENDYLLMNDDDKTTWLFLSDEEKEALIDYKKLKLNADDMAVFTAQTLLANIGGGNWLDDEYDEYGEYLPQGAEGGYDDDDYE